MKPSALGVVILGAGASSRMGKPKLLLPWDDTSIIGHIIRQWQTLGAKQIAVVHRPNDARLIVELARLKFPAAHRIENPQPERGMFSSIVCAANWNGWQGGLDAWAIVLGDQPHLTPETLAKLLAFQRDHADSICQPVFDGHGRHPVLLPRRAFEEVKQTHADTLNDFLKQTAVPIAKCPMDDAGLALDLDTPEDYQRGKNLPSTRP